MKVLSRVAAAAAACLVVAGVAGAAPPWVTVTDDFSEEPALFGLAAAPGNALIVADGGAGPTEIRKGSTSLVAELAGVNDIAPIGQSEMLAVATREAEPCEEEPTATETGLYRVSSGRSVQVADTQVFECEVDPAADGTDEGSNPFDLARLDGHRTLIADAAGNSLLVADQQGRLDWVASLPAKLGLPCPAWFCSGTVPFPVHAVATSVAIGPDGAYYVGELTGFPATPGNSNVWRIEPGAHHARCGSSPACRIVGTGFTSIIDLQFGPDGKLYVVELDEASWLAIEPGGPLTSLGGTINACSLGATLSCTVRASGLPLPTAVAFQDGNLYSTLLALVPGQAQVAQIP